MGPFEDGETFLLLGHLVEQSSVQLLRPKHLPLEREHFPIDLRLDLSLCLQSIQGLLDCRFSLRQVDLRFIESPLGGSRLFRREQFCRPRSCRLGRPVLGLAAGGLQLELKLIDPP